MSETEVTRTASNAERALRRLDNRFDGEGPGRWTFDGKPLEDGPITEALLSMHDYLNDLDRERAAS